MHTVIYHRSDLDGHCSGAIFRLWLEKKYPGETIQMIGASYGDPAPLDKVEANSEVCIADFSYEPFSEMVKLAHVANVTWIDHHKSSRKYYLEALEKGVIDGNSFSFTSLEEEGPAACKKVWQFCHPGEAVPYSVELLSDYDTWRHASLPEIEADRILNFQMGMRLKPTDPEEKIGIWRHLLFKDDTQVDALAYDITQQGITVREYQRQDWGKKARIKCFPVEIQGVRFLAANGGPTNSQYTESQFDPDIHDAILIFYWNGSYGNWKTSFYCEKPNFDMSTIAEYYGGGGHSGAAGCNNLPQEIKEIIFTE